MTLRNPFVVEQQPPLVVFAYFVVGVENSLAVEPDNMYCTEIFGIVAAFVVELAAAFVNGSVRDQLGLLVLVPSVDEVAEGKATAEVAMAVSV